MNALGTTLKFATVGLVLEVLILAGVAALFGELNGYWELVKTFHISFLSSLVGLYSSASVVGLIAEHKIDGLSRGVYSILVFAVSSTLICLFVQSFAGASVEFFKNSQTSFAAYDYLFRPVFGVMLFGTIPAVLVGLGYAAGLRKLARIR